MPDLNEFNAIWACFVVTSLILLFVATIAMRAEEKAEKASRKAGRNQNEDIAKLTETVGTLSSLAQIFQNQMKLTTKLWDEQLDENRKLERDIKSLDAMILAVKENTEKELERLRAEGPEDCSCRPKSMGHRNASEVHDDGTTWQL